MGGWLRAQSLLRHVAPRDRKELTWYLPGSLTSSARAHTCVVVRSSFVIMELHNFNACRELVCKCGLATRGGLVQAILHAVPEGRSPEDTFVWCDIFDVNQHLRSPYGGLLAFAFEPLRNAMLEVS